MDRLLLIILVIPVIAGLFGSDLSMENRVRKKFPNVPGTLSELDVFFSEVDAFVSDNIGLRNQMIEVKRSVDKTLNGGGNSLVIAGSEGWLFYNAPSVIDRNSGREFLPWRVTNMTRYVQEAQDLATSVGAHFIAIPVPNKHAVYNAKLPRWARAEDTERSEQRAIVHEIGSLGVPLSDPYLLFKNFDLDATPLYFKRDTHWNEFGAYIAFYDAIVQLGLAADLPAPMNLLQGFEEGSFFGVLDQFSGLSEAAESESLPILDMTAFGVAELEFNEIDDHVSMDSYIVSYDTKQVGHSRKPRLLIIGDSFTYDLFRPYWGSVFGEVRWSHHGHGKYNRAAIEEFQPDFVIFEFVDWEIPAWVLHETLRASQ
ncbi:alginate O-acetyltransferase AlgX-related protein [Aliiruegeria lutimaris]|uniref:SGNH hydrolase-like domain-containing protein, acetyltransferase AlgX n=1 Tax=Aliiruegeria lutimaris TaxID=571298 RepID=A0A1G9DDS2_9RHOB|nr:hypothetical protein [Aliiruegeria lutimaris]SDK61979.1 SGNH hydrolase-like domain-containing protein, acetyltransferase AlgX [Aliiruegeria lutimaris]